jgi:flagellar protein FlgJ
MDPTVAPALPPMAGLPASSLPVATPAQRKKIQDTSEAFEAQMLSSLLQPMFKGTFASAPFGGGATTEQYSSFLTDAIAKQTVKAGGVGLAPVVMREMLKMQGLQ